MFNNSEELKELIKQGKTNDEIITKRLSYLESNNSNTIEPIFNGTQVIFYDGYINSSTLISADDGYIDETLYLTDIDELYSELIDVVRKNIDKNGLPLKIILKKVWDYFAESKTSQYAELIKFIKQLVPEKKYFARTYLPYIIQRYNCSNYDGNITDFGKAFIWNQFGTSETKQRHSDEIDKYLTSLDFKKIDTSNICRLSSLKGAGIAACTEKSLAIQNCLSFLGTKSYIVAGILSNGQTEEHHNFNVLKDKNGNYKIIDGAQATIIKLENIDKPEALLYLDGIEGINGVGNSITYTAYYAQKNKNKH